MDGLKRLLADRRTVRVCQVVIGILFAVAALSKLGDLSSLSRQVHNFRIAPVWSENLVAIMLPWVELVASLALILGVRARAGALVLVILLVGFTGGVALAVARGLDFECGCFGTADQTRVGFAKLVQNAGMLIVALVAFRRPRQAGASMSPIPAGPRRA